MTGNTEPKTDEMKPIKKRNIKSYVVPLVLGAYMVALLFFEWGFGRRGSPFYFLLFVVFAVLFIINYVSLVRSRSCMSRGKRISLWIATGLGAVLWIFVIASFLITTEHERWTDQEIENVVPAIFADEPLPEAYKELYRNGSVVVVGKPRGTIEKHFKGYSSDSSLELIDDGKKRESFCRYAQLIDSSINYLESPKYCDEKYLQWQYPQYLPLAFDIERSGEKYSDYRTFSGLHPEEDFFQDPWLFQILEGTIFDRFKAYGRMVEFVFLSPFYRTDLVNDPIFYAIKGEYNAAFEGLAALPADRKSIVDILIPDEFSNRIICEQDDIPKLECEALNKIAASTKMSLWREKNGWGQSIKPCERHGVTCDSSHVVELDLWKNNLNGTIPIEIGDLIHLKDMNLSQNELVGSIPKELGNLKNLRSLDLYSNKLSGSIPKELGSLSELESLTLSYNEVTGSIPKELGNLKTLGNLDLNNNKLSGSIPKEFGGLSELESLTLRNNEVTGSIPKELGNLSKLASLDLSVNRLTGPIPNELGKLFHLEKLYLYRNRLSGEIPENLIVLSGIRIVQLEGNECFVAPNQKMTDVLNKFGSKWNDGCKDVD